MKVWKRWLSVFLCLGLLMGLWGCGGRELYERLLIHGIGVDVKGDGFTVTVRSSISPEDQGEEYFRCEGRSVLEALNSLTLSTGRKPFYAHNYLVVFGRECGERGLDRCLDFFIRYYNTRPGVQMYLAEGTAEEILSSQKDGKYLKMSELQQLGDSSKDNGRTVSVDILDFVNGVKREGSSAVLPVLRAGEEGSVEIASTAYFSGYKLAGFLSLEETRGFLAARGLLQSGEAVVSGESFGAVTLSLSGASGSVALQWGEDGRPQFEITVDTEADVSAVSGGRDFLEMGIYGQVERALSELLEQEIEQALEKTVLRGRCDIFGFGNLLYRRAPDYWKENREDWASLMAQCGYTVYVSSKVQRLEQSGMIRAK